MKEIREHIDWSKLESGEATDPQVQAVFDCFVNQLAGPEISNKWSADHGYARLQSQWLDHHTDHPPVLNTRRNFDISVRHIAVALSVLLVALATFTGVSRMLDSGEELVRTYSTGIGQQSTVSLEDGSSVILAPNTHMRVTTDPANPTRSVELVGKAYFRIDASSTAPFVVKTGNIQTRVLGTMFVISNYPQRSVNVTVVEGKVAVSVDKGDNAVLTAGSGVSVDGSVIRSLQATNLIVDTSWISNRLTFDNTPVIDMLNTLSHWYGVEFIVSEPSLTNRNVTGAFTVGSVSEMMQMLEELLNIDVLREDKGSSSRIVISSRYAE